MKKQRLVDFLKIYELLERIVLLEVRTDSGILAFHGSFLEEVCRQYAACY